MFVIRDVQKMYSSFLNGDLERSANCLVEKLRIFAENKLLMLL